MARKRKLETESSGNILGSDELVQNGCISNSDVQEDSQEGSKEKEEELEEIITDGVKQAESEQQDEYAEGDSSDEEEIMNTIGNVPTEWYDECDHIGFDHTGEKIYKPDRGDGLDAFLRRIEDPNYMRTVVDRLTGQDVVLVDDDLELVQRLVKAQVPSAQYNLYEPFMDLYSHEVMETPLSGRPEHKRSFLPSRSEREKVSKMVHNIKQNLIHQHQRPKRYQSFDLWKSDHIPVPIRRRRNPKYKAPPSKLPTNSNSYNPPPEFLPTKYQLDWIRSKHVKQRAEINNRLPKKYDSLRLVPNHKTYVMDVFNRCLDLYMSSRFAYKKIVGTSKDLLPELPRPRDLRPFPTKEALLFAGHTKAVNALAVHPLGKILATGSKDETVRIWDISNGRCIRTLEMGGEVKCLAWNPSNKVLVLAVCVDKRVVMVNPESYLTEASIVTRTNALFLAPPQQGDYEITKKVERAVTWVQPSASEREQGYRIVLKHSCAVVQIVWHPQGDYFATLQPEAKSSSVVIHQLSRHRSQIPFSKSAIKVTAMSFHPKKAYFYICCQGRVRVYSLLQKKLIRLIRTSAASGRISSISVHPSGEHFIIGSLDKRLTWYEMEATNRPYTLRYHKNAIRSVAFHNKYPLLASASDDGSVIVTHAMVYNDWIKDPLIVPVKELKSHEFEDFQCVLQLAWHPFNPVLFTAGADRTVRLWQ
ncbi:WD40 repeat [Trinorchestia longiramus]|nr:WD40 repeat [Trinorchestia longiramus]